MDVTPEGSTFTIYEMFEKMQQLWGNQVYQAVEHSIKFWV